MQVLTVYQGWKLQTVCLSGIGKNGARQVKILDTFPEERLKLWKLLFAFLLRTLRTAKNSAGQVDLFNTFPPLYIYKKKIGTYPLCSASWYLLVLYYASFSFHFDLKDKRKKKH